MNWGLYIGLGLIFAALPAVASADILEWTDSAGVTHYTNLKAEVPAEQAAQVVVDEQVWVPQGPASPEVKEDDPVVQPPPPDTEDETARAYVAGLESGLARNPGAGPSVYISGPLAVTISAPTPYSGYGLPGTDWQVPGYYPFLTTAGIGRHRAVTRDRFGTGFHRQFAFSRRLIGPAGPPPIGAAGPPPLGAAGPPPLRSSGGHLRW